MVIRKQGKEKIIRVMEEGEESGMVEKVVKEIIDVIYQERSDEE